MPTEKVATPAPHNMAKSMTRGYVCWLKPPGYQASKMADMPTSPTIAIESRVSRGFFPPALSTQAPNGILRSEPVSWGAATRKPSRVAEIPSADLKFEPSGLISATAVNPTKKPKVAPKRPIPWLPLISYSSDLDTLICLDTRKMRSPGNEVDSW